ncbi:SGNH/GDSL hydrolase family protein [Thalassolituus oleivorans]|uniref:SGNH/GDSL hydrolase family protein n=1 Tax=Thalassolituus oleivorans TaxID=187493 RepID=UPI0023F0DF42|nr:SGNH/GDSL hydrolase family protein [Thalassolituus oleivorans]
MGISANSLPVLPARRGDLAVAIRDNNLILSQHSPMSRTPIYSELGLSLMGNGRSKAYNVSGIDMQTVTQEGVASWLKRWTKNGFVFKQSAGKNGDTNEGALARVQADILDQDIVPNVVNIWLGGNDINFIDDYDEAVTELEAMKADMEAICDLLIDNGIAVIISLLPTNGMWEQRFDQRWVLSEWNEYLRELSYRDGIIAFLNYEHILADPVATFPVENLSVSRTNNIATLNWPSHGVPDGHGIMVFDAGNSSFNTITPLVGVIATYVDDDTLSYESVGTDSSTTASAVRLSTMPDLAIDITTHFNARCASKGALQMIDVFKTLFPPRNLLPASENDMRNLMGCGLSLTRNRFNLGMMLGAGGTAEGTPLPVGDIADGYTLKVVSGGATVVPTLEPDGTDAYSQYTWQRLDITAGAQDAEITFGINHTRPGQWIASQLMSPGKVVRPKIANGYFYVNLVDGFVTSGATEPVWPTRPGETVVDGGVTWQCRLGWVAGVTKCNAVGAYQVLAMDKDAINCLSFGIFDVTDPAGSILDFTSKSETYSPYHFVGEDGHFGTPDGTILDGSTSIFVGAKIRIKANKTASVRLTQFGWRPIKD